MKKFRKLLTKRTIKKIVGKVKPCFGANQDSMLNEYFMWQGRDTVEELLANQAWQQQIQEALNLKLKSNQFNFTQYLSNSLVPFAAEIWITPKKTVTKDSNDAFDDGFNGTFCPLPPNPYKYVRVPNKPKQLIIVGLKKDGPNK